MICIFILRGRNVRCFSPNRVRHSIAGAVARNRARTTKNGMDEGKITEKVANVHDDFNVTYYCLDRCVHASAFRSE